MDSIEGWSEEASYGRVRELVRYLAERGGDVSRSALYRSYHKGRTKTFGRTLDAGIQLGVLDDYATWGTTGWQRRVRLHPESDDGALVTVEAACGELGLSPQFFGKIIRQAFPETFSPTMLIHRKGIAAIQAPRNPLPRMIRPVPPLTAAPFVEIAAGGCLYFIQGRDGGPIKIGMTSALGARLASLQAASPLTLVVLAIIPSAPSGQTGYREIDLHELFAGHRLHGEWFVPAPELLDFIAANAIPVNLELADLRAALGDAAWLRERVQ